MFAKWEWIIVELLVLGFLVAELVSVRRSIRRDKAQSDAEGKGRRSC
jgi:hypothetical protein